jgi:hypothetical protein
VNIPCLRCWEYIWKSSVIASRYIEGDEASGMRNKIDAKPGMTASHILGNFMEFYLGFYRKVIASNNIVVLWPHVCTLWAERTR